MERQWILEFLLRQPVAESDLFRLISALFFSAPDNRVLKTMLLRKISSVITKDLISEKILDSLELIQEIDYLDGVLVLDSMKAAYRAVAKGCIMKNLKEERVDNDVVDRIWVDRILAMEECNVDLVSDWSNELKIEIEEAMRDVSVLRSVSVESVEKDAIDAVNLFLKHTLDLMGPSFLEGLGKTLLDVGDAATRNDHVRAEEEEVETTSTTGVPCVTKSRVNAEITPKFREVEDMDIEPCRELMPSERALETVNGIGDNVVYLSDSSLEGEFGEAESCRFDAVDQRREASHESMPGGACSEMGVHSSAERSEMATKKCNPVSTPEFNRVQEALKSSVLKLQEAVEDPLPDALEIAARIAREVANNFQTSENQDDIDMDISDNSTDYEIGQAREGNSKPAAGVSRPTILERNNTARTYEWKDDEEESSTEVSRMHLHLPSPQSIRISPIRKQVIRDTSVTGRRIKKKWSSLEASTLTAAVREHGKGNWKIMLNAYREIFEGRTEGDLKDKWRNLTK